METMEVSRRFRQRATQVVYSARSCKEKISQPTNHPTRTIPSHHYPPTRYTQLKVGRIASPTPILENRFRDQKNENIKKKAKQLNKPSFVPRPVCSLLYFRNMTLKKPSLFFSVRGHHNSFKPFCAPTPHILPLIDIPSR